MSEESLVKKEETKEEEAIVMNKTIDHDGAESPKDEAAMRTSL